MLESTVEGKLKKRIRVMGGKCLKWVSPGFVGVPDRMVLMPGGAVAFVETKAPGKRERPRQEYVQRVLRDLGFTVFSAVDSDARIEEVLEWARATQTTE